VAEKLMQTDLQISQQLIECSLLWCAYIQSGP